MGFCEKLEAMLDTDAFCPANTIGNNAILKLNAGAGRNGGSCDQGGMLYRMHNPLGGAERIFRGSP